jgi:alkylation response protein AidB-like acyl-CoA dehydrogenase
VDFGFDAEQEQLRASAERVLAASSPLALARAAHDDPDAWREPWKTIVDLGWTAMAVPEEHGGLGLGVVDVVGLAEMTGRWVLPAPFVSTVGLATPALVAIGAIAALERVAAGGVATLAASAPGAPAAARIEGDGRLRGIHRTVPDAARADVLVAVAEASGGETVAVVVEADRPGVRIEPVWSIDPTRPLATVHFDGVEVDRDAIAPIEPHVLDAGLAALAAELVGVADRVLEIAVAHARGRHQFGQPIGGFQGVKHRLADGYVAIERARTLAYNAAMVLDDATTSAGQGALAAAMAKAAASEAAVTVAKTGIQVHGAIAITWEHDLHLLSRRARQSALCLGDHTWHYRRVAELYAGAG